MATKPSSTPPAPITHYVWAARLLTLGWGIVAITFAMTLTLFENLIEAVNIIGSLFYGAILGLFLIAFFIRRIGGTAAFIGAVVAELIVLTLFFSPIDIGYLWFNLIGCAICVGIALAVQTHPPTTTPAMTDAPVICFGQQPCGFLPRRFLFAKIQTALRLRDRIGGRIVFFYHDSDHDPRETQTILVEEKTGDEQRLNFQFANKTQKKFSPLYAKFIAPDWQTHHHPPAPQIPRPDRRSTRSNRSPRPTPPTSASTSTAPSDSSTASKSPGPATPPFARPPAPSTTISSTSNTKAKSSAPDDHPTTDSDSTGAATPTSTSPRKSGTNVRSAPPVTPASRWMQSVIHCTHYVAGAGEMDYLDTSQAPEIEFLRRDDISHASQAYLP